MVFMAECPHIRLLIQILQYRNGAKICQSHTTKSQHSIFKYHHPADHFYTHAYGAEHTDFLGPYLHPIAQIVYHIDQHQDKRDHRDPHHIYHLFPEKRLIFLDV